MFESHQARRDPALPSGRFVLRIDPGLHAALREAAHVSGMSLNEYCARKLAAASVNIVDPAADSIERAAALFGEALVGVVAFGSWARDELTEGSDVDLLVVVEPTVKITRSLYREWDASPLRWDSRRVEPHLVHLPERRGRVSGLWAEVAVDGVVLFERGLQVSRWLLEVRSEIAAGRIMRRQAQGQPYWVEAS